MIDLCVASTMFVVNVMILNSCSWTSRGDAVDAAAVVSTRTTLTDADCFLTCQHHVSSQCIGQRVVHAVTNSSISGSHRFCGIVEIIPKGKYLAGFYANKSLDVRTCSNGTFQAADAISLEHPRCIDHHQCKQPVLRTIVEGTTVSDAVCGCNGEAGYVASNEQHVNGQLGVNDCHGIVSPTELDIDLGLLFEQGQPTIATTADIIQCVRVGADCRVMLDYSWQLCGRYTSAKDALLLPMSS